MWLRHTFHNQKAKTIFLQQKIDEQKAIEIEKHETYSIPPSYHFQEKAGSPKHTNSKHAMWAISHSTTARSHSYPTSAFKVQSSPSWKPEIEHEVICIQQMRNQNSISRGRSHKANSKHVSLSHPHPLLPQQTEPCPDLVKHTHTPSQHVKPSRSCTTSPTHLSKNAHSPHGETSKWGGRIDQKHDPA